MTSLDVISKPEHGSPEWLAARHRDKDGQARLTASVAGVLFGEHEFIKPADLALQMLRDEPPDEQMTEAMERGHDLEPALLDRYARKKGVEVVRPDVMYVRDRWLANLDGVNVVDKLPVEAKTTSHRFRPEWFGENPFRYWYWQGVAQAWCYHGHEGAVDWMVIDGGLNFHPPFRQWVSNQEIEQLRRAGDEWLSYIDNGMVPLVVEMDAKHLATLHQGETGSIDLPADALPWVRNLVSARRLKRLAEADEDEAKERLARLLNGKEVGLFNGEEIVTWKEQPGRLGFDMATFRREYPDLYQKFEKRGAPFRTMRPKGETDE